MTDTSAEAVQKVMAPLGCDYEFVHDLVEALVAERDTLRQQLAEARNAALDEAAAVAGAHLLVDWKNRESPEVDGANRMKDAIKRSILALKTEGNQAND